MTDPSSGQPPSFDKQQPQGQHQGQPQQPYGAHPPYGPPPTWPPYGHQPGQPSFSGPPYGPAPYGGVDKPLGWFIVNWIFLWPLAIYSLVSAWQKIDPALFYGDIAGAQYQARRVRKFGIIALCVGIAWTALWLIVVVVFATVAPVHSGVMIEP